MPGSEPTPSHTGAVLPVLVVLVVLVACVLDVVCEVLLEVAPPEPPPPVDPLGSPGVMWKIRLQAAAHESRAAGSRRVSDLPREEACMGALRWRSLPRLPRAHGVRKE